MEPDFLHPFIKGHLSCSLIVIIVKNAAMDMGMQIPLQDPISTSFTKVRLGDHTVVLFLIL